MRYTIPGCHAILLLALLTLILPGCSSPPAPPSKTTVRRDSVIYVGMLFDEADAKLKQHGAIPTMYQVIPVNYEQGDELHFYALRSGVVMDMISKPAKFGRVVDFMSVSTYVPKSWNSKLDSERSRFFESFESRAEYDLEEKAGPAATDNLDNAPR
ncbi:MAG: hypothetical protein LBM04_07910 [Opitutaceae bacterium]|jgi:hypothetical protein|nr:hypothetical protein [Opitutaceae bacterium]